MPSIGIPPSVTKAAGGPGVKHVADCVVITATNIVASGGGAGQVLLEDGSAGAAKLLQWNLAAPNFANGVATVHVCGLSVVGSANTAMTLRFGSFGGSMAASVNLVGHDAM